MNRLTSCYSISPYFFHTYFQKIYNPYSKIFSYRLHACKFKFYHITPSFVKQKMRRGRPAGVRTLPFSNGACHFLSASTLFLANVYSPHSVYSTAPFENSVCRIKNCFLAPTRRGVAVTPTYPRQPPCPLVGAFSGFSVL